MEAEAYRDSIHIAAAPETVFEYFTNPQLLVRWMGDEAQLDPRPGGQFRLVIGQRTVEGRYLSLERPHRVVISWGRRGSRLLPPGRSVLEVSLTAEAGGTRVSVVHSGLPVTESPRHALGWRHACQRRPLWPARYREPTTCTGLAALLRAAEARCRGSRSRRSRRAERPDGGCRLTSRPHPWHGHILFGASGLAGPIRDFPHRRLDPLS